MMMIEAREKQLGDLTERQKFVYRTGQCAPPRPLNPPSGLAATAAGDPPLGEPPAALPVGPGPGLAALLKNFLLTLTELNFLGAIGADAGVVLDVAEPAGEGTRTNDEGKASLVDNAAAAVIGADVLSEGRVASTASLCCFKLSSVTGTEGDGSSWDGTVSTTGSDSSLVVEDVTAVSLATVFVMFSFAPVSGSELAPPASDTPMSPSTSSSDPTPSPPEGASAALAEAPTCWSLPAPSTALTWSSCCGLSVVIGSFDGEVSVILRCCAYDSMRQ
jgi:hypothetical protein